MARCETLAAASSSRPMRAQWETCWEALRLITSPTALAEAKRSSSMRVGDVVAISASSCCCTLLHQDETDRRNCRWRVSEPFCADDRHYRRPETGGRRRASRVERRVRRPRRRGGPPPPHHHLLAGNHRRAPGG